MDKYWIRNARVKLQSLELFWAGTPANAFMFGNTKTEVNEQFYCRHLRSKFDTITRINDNMQTIHAAVYYCCYKYCIDFNGMCECWKWHRSTRFWSRFISFHFISLLHIVRYVFWFQILSFSLSNDKCWTRLHLHNCELRI